MKHAGDEITAHEYLAEFLIIFVFSNPDRVVFWVELFEEVWDGFGFIFVGITTLEVVKVEGSITTIYNKALRTEVRRFGTRMF